MSDDQRNLSALPLEDRDRGLVLGNKIAIAYMTTGLADLDVERLAIWRLGMKYLGYTLTIEHGQYKVYAPDGGYLGRFNDCGVGAAVGSRAPRSKGEVVTEQRGGAGLYEAAEHALLEMRDRFNLRRGESVSLDALEDALATNRDTNQDTVSR